MTITSDTVAMVNEITTEISSPLKPILLAKFTYPELLLFNSEISTRSAGVSTSTRTAALEEAWDLAIAEAVVVATAAADQAAAIAAVAALDGVYPEWD